MPSYIWGGLSVATDGWSTKERGVDGRLQADPKKFPSGLKALSDRLAGMGERLHEVKPMVHPRQMPRARGALWFDRAETLHITVAIADSGAAIGSSMLKLHPLMDLGYTLAPEQALLAASPAACLQNPAADARMLHAGIQLGLFGDAGTRTWGGAAASYGHEELDAQTFASWGISYLKYDNCYAVKKDKWALHTPHSYLFT
jgi:hypothetical protein